MRKCAFTGIQHREVTVFKNFCFRPFTRVQTKQQLGKLILGKTLTSDKVCTDLGIYLDSGLTLILMLTLKCPRFFLHCVKLKEYGISLINQYF